MDVILVNILIIDKHLAFWVIKTLSTPLQDFYGFRVLELYNLTQIPVKQFFILFFLVWISRLDAGFTKVSGYEILKNMDHDFIITFKAICV